MATQVIKFETGNGMLFDTEHEALVYEARGKVSDRLYDWIDDNTSLRSHDVSDMVNLIMENPHSLLNILSPLTDIKE